MEAYVMQESESLRIFVSKKRYDTQSLNERLHEKPLEKDGKGKDNRYGVYYQVPASILL
jgi:hypothetical protein